jgi:glutaconate CoA-transferase subunit B
MSRVEWSMDELLCVCIAREISDGDVLLEGIGAFLPTAAYELARLTHAPGVVSWSSIGSVFRTDFVPLSLSGYESATLDVGVARASYGEIALWYLPKYLRREDPVWKEFMRPAQVDARGNTNNVVIGDYHRPDVRLPGGVGLPDGAPIERTVSMYLPRHDRLAVVDRVDFISAPGYPETSSAGDETPNPHVLISDLGVFRFHRDGCLRILSLHPGVSAEVVRERSGCDVAIGDETVETTPPIAEEVQVLRDVVDPLGLRRLELLSRKRRFDALRDVIAGRPVQPPEAR